MTGLYQAKTVRSPRKLDTLLKPYGYANKQGKIITLDEAAALPPSSVKSTVKKVVTPAIAIADTGDEDAGNSPTPAPKKRKVNTGKGHSTAAVKELTPESSIKDEGNEED